MPAVVVLTYAPAPGMLEACLASVLGSGDADGVILVDNGGRVDPSTVPAGVELVRPAANHGYAGGMNAGIERALARGSRDVALLNDDVVVEPGWLGPLVAELAAEPRLGAVQPKLLHGTPGGEARINSMGVTLDRYGAGHDLAAGEIDSPEHAGTLAIDLFTGGAVLLRGEMLREIGTFDERFFLYYEDVQLGLRGRARGWSYRCVPASRVWHRGSATVAALGDRARFLQERNRLWCAVEWASPRVVLAAFWLSVRRLRWAPRGVHARSLAAGLAHVPRGLLIRLRRRR